MSCLKVKVTQRGVSKETLSQVTNRHHFLDWHDRCAILKLCHKGNGERLALLVIQIIGQEISIRRGLAIREL